MTQIVLAFSACLARCSAYGRKISVQHAFDILKDIPDPEIQVAGRGDGGIRLDEGSALDRC